MYNVHTHALTEEQQAVTGSAPKPTQPVLLQQLARLAEEIRDGQARLTGERQPGETTDVPNEVGGVADSGYQNAANEVCDSDCGETRSPVPLTHASKTEKVAAGEKEGAAQSQGVWAQRQVWSALEHNSKENEIQEDEIGEDEIGEDEMEECNEPRVVSLDLGSHVQITNTRPASQSSETQASNMAAAAAIETGNPTARATSPLVVRQSFVNV